MKKIGNILDEFHYHEALDRAYIIGCIAEDFLTKHPVFIKHGKLRKKANQVTKLLGEIYQEIGVLDENSKLKKQ